MRNIYLQENTFEQDIRELTMAFFPGETINVKVLGEEIYLQARCGELGLFIYEKMGQLIIEYQERVEAAAEKEDWTKKYGGYIRPKEKTNIFFESCQSTYETRKEGKDRLKRTLYTLYQKVTGITLPWGTLTGIRPTKPVLAMMEAGRSDEEIRRRMEENYFCSSEKIQLTLETARKEKSLIGQVDRKEGYSLYVGIPFCPTTCAYCSFTSYPLEWFRNQVEAYLDCLKKELVFLAERMAKRRLNAVYIGGGTPTTLTPQQLDDLLGTIRSLFSMEYCLEFTVEAGRPDSITREKLLVLKEHQVDRISINPQTMNEETLKRIGRKHTIQEVKDAFFLARELGFTNINMDFIVGLPGETIEDVAATMEEVKKLDPDSITVHSLAIKRAARLHTKAEEFSNLTVENTWETIALTQRCVREMGMEPYYLYRQKNMAGNFENVGYAKPGKEGLYNILIMEELQTIVAAGAGGTTKIVYPEENRLERIENVKDLKSYISRIDEMLARKNILKQEILETNWEEEAMLEAIDHGVRVSRLAVTIARECGYSEAVCYEIALAGVLHDIGKLSMHSYFYGEEALLVDSVHDMHYMRQHARYSYEILKARGGYSEFILEAVLYHHENFDGTGYPSRLRGQDIPFAARILRISDVFVALTSHRPYRQAFDKNTAIRIMIDDVKNFDMQFFLVFQRIVNTRWEQENLGFALKSINEIK